MPCRERARGEPDVRAVIDLDIVKYFDSISHPHLRAFLDRRVTDGVIRRMIDKWLSYARALAAITDWCRKHRHLPIPEQHAHLITKMRGHYAYFGITGNHRRLNWYASRVRKIWKKWLSRRGSRLSWDRFLNLLTRHPLPHARIIHRYSAVSETLP
jgi:hypothetical protein